MCRQKCVSLILLVMSTGWIITSQQSNDIELTKELINPRGVALYEELATHLGDQTNDCEKGRALTKLHQTWLYTNYRGVFQYRLFGHNYKRLGRTKKGLKDTEDKPSYSGSVIFLNFQSTRLTMVCPCGTGSVENWKMYGEGSAEFNEDSTATTKSLTVRAPPQRMYYRTFSCTADKSTHFFNVFTRPIGLTTVPPLMFTEGISGPADSVNKVICNLTMYRTLKPKPAKYYVIQAPYRFYWQFPAHEPRKPLTEHQQQVDEDRKEENRPPLESVHRDNLFWTGTVPHLPRTSNISYLALAEEKPTAVADICKIPNGSQKPVVLSNDLKVTTKRAQKEHAGVYVCIVEDRNGLTSAYWWDGDPAPQTPFRGFTHIRVREILWVYIAIGVFIGLGIIVTLMMLVLPDNKEDFTEDVTGEGPLPPPPVQTEPLDAVTMQSRHSVIKMADPGPSHTTIRTSGAVAERMSIAPLHAVRSADLLLDTKGHTIVKGGMFKRTGSNPTASTKSLTKGKGGVKEKR